MSRQPDNKPTLRRDGFTFKQFFVAHDRCAMKVSTDGILLGAWAPVAGARRILDIGCGSGLIALMLAQRTDTDVDIDAVELDALASRQALANVSASPWAGRIRVYADDIVDFTAATEKDYALIVSNPPYFAPGVACADHSRTQARHTTSLTHERLLDCARQRISSDGLFGVVLPAEVAQKTFLPLAHQRGWFVRQQMRITETASRPAHRVLIALSRQPGECLTRHLVIRDGKGYSADFQRLTKDFYLFM